MAEVSIFQVINNLFVFHLFGLIRKNSLVQIFEEILCIGLMRDLCKQSNILHDFRKLLCKRVPANKMAERKAWLVNRTKI